MKKETWLTWVWAIRQILPKLKSRLMESTSCPFLRMQRFSPGHLRQKPNFGVNRNMYENLHVPFVL